MILRTLDNQLNKNPSRINSICREFIDAFLENLWNYEFKCTSNEFKVFEEELINNLHSYKKLREDYIQFLIKVTHCEYNLDIDILINLFEKAPQYKRPKESERGVSYSSANYVNFEIIFHELFIYTIAICYKNSNFTLLGDLLHSGYYFDDIREINTDSKKYSELYSYHTHLEDYYNKKCNKITGFGHFAITYLSDKINKMDFILADTICHYVSELQKYNAYSRWFPSTYLYKFDNQFDFFKKLASKRYFEKVKGIFNVNKPMNYKENTKREHRQRVGYGSRVINGDIPFVFEAIDIEKLATER